MQQVMQQQLERCGHVTFDDLHPYISIISDVHCDANTLT